VQFGNDENTKTTLAYKAKLAAINELIKNGAYGDLATQDGLNKLNAMKFSDDPSVGRTKLGLGSNEPTGNDLLPEEDPTPRGYYPMFLSPEGIDMLSRALKKNFKRDE
jgi:hypothetical protein